MDTLEPGCVCVRIRGNERGRIAVVVAQLERGFVLVDGDVRRRPCDPRHLQPLGITVAVGEDSTRDEILKALEGHELLDRANQILHDHLTAKDLGKILLANGWRFVREWNGERTYEKEGKTLVLPVRGGKVLDGGEVVGLMIDARLERSETTAINLVRRPRGW